MPKRDPLREIPGVGSSISTDLHALGIDVVSDLVGRDPVQLYERLCRLSGVRQDPCVLYVFRCAVYYASEPEPDPDLMLWWNWKNRTELDVRVSPTST